LAFRDDKDFINSVFLFIFMERLNKEFFRRDPDVAAKELLGKIIVRKTNNKEMRARIVETEAYFDSKDPASRACRNGDICNTMMMDAGTILIFNVHNNWLLNFVTGEEGKAEAALIRAVEPLNFNGKCNGPGLLTRALFIEKRFHKQNIINNKEIFLVDDGFNDFNVDYDFRIGVRKDLKKKLRFYISENKHV